MVSVMVTICSHWIVYVMLCVSIGQHDCVILSGGCCGLESL